MPDVVCRASPATAMSADSFPDVDRVFHMPRRTDEAVEATPGRPGSSNSAFDGVPSFTATRGGRELRMERDAAADPAVASAAPQVEDEDRCTEHEPGGP